MVGSKVVDGIVPMIVDFKNETEPEAAERYCHERGVDLIDLAWLMEARNLLRLPQLPDRAILWVVFPSYEVHCIDLALSDVARHHIYRVDANSCYAICTPHDVELPLFVHQTVVRAVIIIVHVLASLGCVFAIVTGRSTSAMKWGYICLIAHSASVVAGSVAGMLGIRYKAWAIGFGMTNNVLLTYFMALQVLAYFRLSVNNQISFGALWAFVNGLVCYILEWYGASIYSEYVGFFLFKSAFKEYGIG